MQVLKSASMAVSRKYLIDFLHFLSWVDGTARFKMICKFMAYIVKRLKIASKGQK